MESGLAVPWVGTIDVMPEPSPFHERRPGLVSPVRVDPRGITGPTRSQARGPRWRTTSRGLVQRPARRRHALDVPLVARRHLVAQPGFEVSQEFLAPAEIVTVDGLPLTSSLRSVTYAMRYAFGLGDAVVALDMACYADLVSVAEVAAYVEGLGPVTGIQQARDAVPEAEENSWSPQETRMRGVWTRRAGLPRPRCNVPVFTPDGRHVGTPDMVAQTLGLVGLYNGRVHLTVAGAATDIKQEEAYRDLGLETVTMVASDWTDLDDFVARLRSAARRARARTGDRGWTLDPPPWWTSTETVAARRALGAAERERYLRYRRAA